MHYFFRKSPNQNYQQHLRIKFDPHPPQKKIGNLPSLKLTVRPWKWPGPKRKWIFQHIPTIHFQVLWLLVSGRVNYHVKNPAALQVRDKLDFLSLWQAHQAPPRDVRCVSGLPSRLRERGEVPERCGVFFWKLTLCGPKKTLMNCVFLKQECFFNDLTFVDTAYYPPEV